MTAGTYFYLSGDVLAAYSRQKVDWNQLKCLTAFRIIFSSLIISLKGTKGPIFACLISAKNWYRLVEMVYRLSNKIFQPFWKSQRTLRTHFTSRKYIFLNSRKFWFENLKTSDFRIRFSSVLYPFKAQKFQLWQFWVLRRIFF